MYGPEFDLKRKTAESDEERKKWLAESPPELR
jgi:hypothetical protein